MSQTKISKLLEDKKFKPHHYNTGEAIDWTSSTGSISFGIAFVAGSILVPKPAAGIMTFLILFTRFRSMFFQRLSHDYSVSKVCLSELSSRNS